MFSCEFYEITKNTFFTVYLRATAARKLGAIFCPTLLDTVPLQPHYQDQLPIKKLRKKCFHVIGYSLWKEHFPDR